VRERSTVKKNVATGVEESCLRGKEVRPDLSKKVVQ